MSNIEIWTGAASPNLELPKSIGYKFKTDGSAEYFDANTIICHVDQTSELYVKLLEIREELINLPFANKFAFMPPESYHMTLFVGCNDRVRTREEWSNLFGLDASIDEITDAFITRLSGVKGIPSSFIMKPEAISANNSGCVTLMLEPADEEQSKILSKSRDILSDKTGIRRLDHEHYKYHITFSYQIDWLTSDEAAHLDTLLKKLFDNHFNKNSEICISKAQLCRLFSMNKFDPTLTL